MGTLGILLRSRHNRKADTRFFRKRLKGRSYVTRVIVADSLKRDGAPLRDLMPGVEPQRHKRLHNQVNDRTNRLDTKSVRGDGARHQSQPTDT